mmetsp:Transcript_22491/g.68551  ORF Transcript_22491/g.68551 Transcript_22491/m.68551 type:complete len:239 (+) Transcript_22491:700-1416(+)
MATGFPHCTASPYKAQRAVGKAWLCLLQQSQCPPGLCAHRVRAIPGMAAAKVGKEDELLSIWIEENIGLCSTKPPRKYVVRRDHGRPLAVGQSGDWQPNWRSICYARRRLLKLRILAVDLTLHSGKVCRRKVQAGMRDLHRHVWDRHVWEPIRCAAQERMHQVRWNVWTSPGSNLHAHRSQVRVHHRMRVHHAGSRLDHTCSHREQALATPVDPKDRHARCTNCVLGFHGDLGQVWQP